MLSALFFLSDSNIFSTRDIRLVQNFLAGGFLINLYGYLDDKLELKPTVKLGSQVFSVIIYATLSSHLISSHHSQVVFLIICFWGLGVVNGSNLLDGLDTLTLKIGAVSYSTFLFLGLYYSSPKLVITSSIFMSCLMGFYYFNREPAKVHLGEIGGSLVGFSMLLLSSFLWSAVKGSGHNLISAGALAIIPLTLPMIELGISFLRRIYNRKSPFRGDKLHVHHILSRDYGFSPSTVSSLMGLAYFLTIAVAVGLLIFVHPVIALISLIALQASLYIMIGKNYWSSESSMSITPTTLLGLLMKKDITIIESSLIDNFQLIILKEEIGGIDEEEDTSQAA